MVGPSLAEQPENSFGTARTTMFSPEDDLRTVAETAVRVSRSPEPGVGKRSHHSIGKRNRTLERRLRLAVCGHQPFGFSTQRDRLLPKRPWQGRAGSLPSTGWVKSAGAPTSPCLSIVVTRCPFSHLPFSLNLPQITIQPIEGLLDEVVSGKTDVLEGSKGNRTHVVAKGILLSRAILSGFLSYDGQTGSWLTEATANSAR